LKQVYTFTYALALAAQYGAKLKITGKYNSLVIGNMSHTTWVLPVFENM
jgi:hypothetical protein